MLGLIGALSSVKMAFCGRFANTRGKCVQLYECDRARQRYIKKRNERNELEKWINSFGLLYVCAVSWKYLKVEGWCFQSTIWVLKGLPKRILLGCFKSNMFVKLPKGIHFNIIMFNINY